ncbi:MAG: hypothetical protein ABEI99_10415 [Halobaculum sp.]
MADSKTELVSTLRDAGGDSLRDAWLFDEVGHESLYLRDDVASRVADLEVDRYIDNERYGYVTRETYESLHYTEYEFTIRGFDEFLQYRTFLGTVDDDHVGLMASFDPNVGIDFRTLTESLYEVAGGNPIEVVAE